MPKPSLKDRIVEAAVTTLHERGFNGTSVQDITDAAGAPKGSFYNHFKSKEALTAEALELYWRRGSRLLAALNDSKVAGFQRLRSYFEALNAHGRSHRFSPGCMIGNFAAEVSDQSEPLRQKIADLLATWTASIEKCVEQGQRDGSIRADLPAAMVAAFLLNSWEGAVLRAKVDKQGDALAAFEVLALASVAPRS